MKHILLKIFYIQLIFLINSIALSNNFQSWIKNLETEILASDISKETFKNNLVILINPNKKVLSYYNNQPEFKITFDEYYNRNINIKRIEKGKNLWIKHKKLLDEVYSHYLIPPEIILAIWGIESNYGSYTGKFNVIEALATLAFKSNRKKFFKKELINSLLIIEKKYTHKNKVLYGSWAGAMGQSQFMPSSYLKYAVDYNKDKKIDIWHSYEDIFASIANYLHLHGWERNEGWSYEIFIKDKYKNRIKNNVIYDINYVSRFMIDSKSIDKFDIKKNIQIKVIKTKLSQRYFIKFKNFNIIKKYNNSDFYALVIGDLANKIKN